MMMWPLPAEEPRPGSRTPQDDHDATLTARVGERLRNDPAVGRSPVTVEVQAGVVLLNGTADSPAAREAAWRIARDTDGVREVCNRIGLTASGPGAGRVTPRSGFDDIAAGLLAQDPSLAAPPRAPRSTSSWIWLGAAAAIAWAVVSLLLVTTPWLAILVTCAAAAVAVELARHPRRLRRGAERRQT